MSVIDDPGGKRRISFIGPQGRKVIYLGKTSHKTADSIDGRVKSILAANKLGQPLDFDTAGWLARLSDRFHQKLAAQGLVSPREAAPQVKAVVLGDFTAEYIRGRTDVKPRTRNNLGQTRRTLLQFFGADRRLDSIAPGDGDDFRCDVLARFSENTARRHCGRAKQFFRAALRKRLIREDPFADMKGCGCKANSARFYFISQDEARKVLDACPDAQWRLLFALSRFGGLRCPSEHLGLRWGDVDWERNRLTIHSPKTEHHEGGESRQIPLFPELRMYLDEVWDQAGDQATSKTEYIITRYRGNNTNLRTQLNRIIRKAGLRPWPKLFQNLRSTRETELVKTYPIHVVCAWIGNSQTVAAKHYLQVRDEDFDRAASDSAETAHLPKKR